MVAVGANSWCQWGRLALLQVECQRRVATGGGSLSLRADSLSLRAQRSSLPPAAEVAEGLPRRCAPRMCGRPRRCKRKMSGLTGRSIALMCPACWRGTQAAGPDGFRDPDPNNDAASRAIASVGSTGSSVRPIVISFSSSTPASTRTRAGAAVRRACRRARHRDPCRLGHRLLNPGRSRAAVRPPCVDGPVDAREK
jgi:hypothetical protein